MQFRTQITLLAVAVASATMAIAAPAPAAAADPAHLPTKNRTGLAQFSDFDGTTACGTTVSADQAVVAITGNLFDKYNPCDRTITITAPNGHQETATIQESCADGCGKDGILLTTSLFSKFYNLQKGTFEATWHFNN